MAKPPPFRKRLGLALLALLLLGGGATALQLVVAGRSAIEGIRHLQAAERVAADAQGREAIATAQAELASARAALDASETGFARLGPVDDVLGAVPGAGRSYAAARQALRIAAEAAALGEDLLVEASAIEQAAQDSAAGDDLRVRLALVERAVDRFRPRVARLSAELDALDLEALPAEYQGRLRKAREQIAVFDQSLARLAAGLAIGRTLLEADEPRSLLVLLQNREELRASGGFIGNYASIRLARGRVEEVAIGSTWERRFNDGEPDPPAPLRAYLAEETWRLRDANWSPDFPTAAQAAERLWTRGGGAAPDLTLAVDLEVVAAMLRATGPITVDPDQPPATADTLSDLIEAQRLAPEGPQHKLYLRRLGALLLDHLTRLDTRAALDLARQLVQAADEGHLLAYSRHPDLAASLAEMGLDGRLPPPVGDALLVVDSNVGGNKADREIERAADLSVVVDEQGQAEYTLTLHYRHGGDGRYPSGPYYDYVRVYVPGEAVPVDLEAPHGGPLEMSCDGAYRVIGWLMTLPPGEEETATLRYTAARLPVAADGRYQLALHKQAGIDERPTSVALLLPRGWTARAEGAAQQTSSDRLRWQDAGRRSTLLGARVQPGASRAAGLAAPAGSGALGGGSAPCRA